MCDVSLAEMNPPPVFNGWYSRFLWCVCVYIHFQGTLANNQRSTTKFQDAVIFVASLHYFAWAGVHLFIRWCRSEGREFDSPKHFLFPWLDFLLLLLPLQTATDYCYCDYCWILIALLLLLTLLLVLLLLFLLLLLLLRFLSNFSAS